jgi:MYXO-CTERM domain-containing protein
MSAFVRPGAMPPESFLSSGGATPQMALGAGTGTDVDAGQPTPPAPDLDASPPEASTAPPLPATAPPSGGCAGCATAPGDASTAGAITALLALAFARLRRRRG